MEASLVINIFPFINVIRIFSDIDMNDHKLQKEGIPYHVHDNAFLEIPDIETAQKLSDRINPEDLHKILDVFAKRYF